MIFARLFDNFAFEKINNHFNFFYSLLTLIIKVWEINDFFDGKYKITVFTKYLKLVDIENNAMFNSLTGFTIHISF